MNLYLHIPFCSAKCAYCAFYSERYQAEKAAQYLTALERELANSKHLSTAIETLYIGGGTPSTLSIHQWRQLVDILQRHADLSACREWTVEANPGTVSLDLADLWQDHGVNRISLGVQSMHDATLSRIGRPHSRDDVINTVAILRAHGFSRLGLDLIAGLPDVSESEWNETLNAVIALKPDHVSCYACSVEPGSRFHQQQANPRFQPADETRMTAALDHAETVLQRAGFEHYEISNYAQPGQRCRHNTNIWKGADYIGFGPAAASRVGLQRWTNSADLDAYCRSAGTPPCESEILAPEIDAAERLAFRFRMPDPVNLDAVIQKLGPAAQHLAAYWQTQFEMLAASGLLTYTRNGWQTTPRGAQLADTIAEALLPSTDE